MELLIKQKKNKQKNRNKKQKKGGIRFCINNLSLQDTATVVTHKTRWFLQNISTRRKICSNKDFLLNKYKYIGFTRFLYKTYLNRWRKKN